VLPHNEEMVILARLALAGMLALAACGPRRPTHVTIDPGLAALVAPDTVMLAGIRFDRLRQSRFYQKLLAAGPKGGIGQYLREAGLDPNGDLWEGLIASDGKEAVILLRGRFSAMGLEPKLERTGAQRMAYKNYMLIGDEQLAVTFLNPSTAAVSRAAVLRSLLERRNEFTGLPRALEDRIRTIEPENQLWGVAIGGMPPLPEEALQGDWGNFAQLLERIRGVTAAAALGDGVTITGRAECASPEDAETLETAARGILGLARLTLRDRPGLASLSDLVAVSRQESRLAIDASIPPEVLERLLEEMRRTR